jgi:lysophospholipid acyltransferase
VIGSLSALTIMNFATVPFLLLTVKDSLEAWATLRWYGLFMVFGALAFFYAGGERVLKGVIRQREKEGRLYVEKKPNVAVVKPNGVGAKVKDESATVTTLHVEKES